MYNFAEKTCFFSKKLLIELIKPKNKTIIPSHTTNRCSSGGKGEYR